MSAPLGSFLIWALAAGIAVFWGLRLWASPLPVPANATVVQPSPAPRGDLTRLLGADPVEPVAATAPAPAVDTRFTLVGVVSPRGSQNQREAMAVISVDGKPARTYRVGAVVEGTRVLQSVSLRGAELGTRGGPVLVSLSLPALVEAARGFPGTPAAAAPGTPGALPMVGLPGNAELRPDGPPGAEGQIPGQDRTKLR